MDTHYARGSVLLQQHRHDLALDQFRLALAEEPNNGRLHTLLALCLVETDQLVPATEEARQAIHLEPDGELGYFVLARALSERNRLTEAEAAARQALRLNPDDPANYSLLAGILFHQRNWEEALATAEEGLELDPEHTGCINMRSMSLVQLGRPDDAEDVLADTLANDPENAYSHASLGWTLLHQGQTRQALEHFREALRLQPDLEFARAGIVEAMKARNIIYAVMLRYFLWMSRLSRRAQWGIILGMYFGYQILRRLADQNPALEPWVTPILIAYMAFAVMTWVSAPLFNLLLRLDRFGRHALSRDQIRSSNCVGIVVLLALASLIWWFFTDKGLWRDLSFVCMVYFWLLLMPVSAIFLVSSGWPRLAMVLYCLALALTPPAALAAWTFHHDQLGSTLMYCYLGGCITSGFVANALMMVQPRR